MPYFDNSATSYPKPEVFYANLAENFRNFGVNASRGRYKQSSEMKKVEERLRANLASQNIFNADAGKIILTPSSTVALNQILQGLDYSDIKTVYISPFEHNAVYRTILYLQSKYDFDLELIPFNKFEWDEGKTKLDFSSKNPDLIVMNHASNVFGNILPVAEIFSLAKQYDAITILDCAQSAGVINVDLQKLKVDFATFAGHKNLYGPSGIGGFVINSNIPLQPVLFGGTGVNSEEIEMPDTLPERYEVGSMNSLGIIGLDLSINWLLKKGVEHIRAKKQDNFQKLLDGLRKYDGITLLYGDQNIGIVSCLFENHNSQEVGSFLDRNDIAVRVGLHCAPLAHNHLGTEPSGTVRFSVGYFNTNEDFIALDKALDKLLIVNC
jgi:cysteine desulfurase family protein